MSFSDPLEVLNVSERNRLETIVMEFEESWDPERLGRVLIDMSTDQDSRFWEIALPELIKVDMQRAWSAGCGQRLDAYLDTYPSLGTQETVRADLVAAEFEARRSVEQRLDVSHYESRFPEQFPIVKQILRDRSQMASKKIADPTHDLEAHDSVASEDGHAPRLRGSQATIDTSRLLDGEPTGNERPLEFVSDLPVEFGRYRILRELGAGAMGRVYLAHDTQLDRQVALKTPSFTEGDNKDLVVRFYREARSAAKLQHRNICPVHDVGKIGVRHFISMAYIQGRPLSDYVRPGKLPKPRSAAMLVQRIAIAMAEAHHHNVIHRDLKPANIMIDRKKEPVVMDFGLARELDSTSQFTQQGVAVGTPAYMAPEQIRGELDEVGKTSDIYALGVILYELLTGRIPFRGPMAKVVYGIVHEPPKPPSEIQPGIDPELEAICLKMMAKERGNRYPSMDDVAAELKKYLKGQSTESETNQSPAEPVTDETATGSAHDPTESNHQAMTSDSAALNAFLASQTEARPSPSIVVPSNGSTRTGSTEHSDADPRIANPDAAQRPNIDGESQPIDGREDATRRNRASFLWVAIGLVFVGLLVAGVTFFMRTGDAVVRVVINDPSIGFQVQNQTLTFDDNGREIKLKPADDNKLFISVGDTTFQTDGTFELLKGENPAVEVTLLSGALVAKLGDIELGRWTMQQDAPSSRSIWVHEKGFFRQNEGGDWVEMSPTGKKFEFAETARSPEFIELRAISGNTSIRVRLFADRAEFANSAALKFKQVFEGWWHTLETDVEQSSESSAVKPGMRFEGALTWNNINASFDRGTTHELVLEMQRISGPRFWGTLQIEWLDAPDGMEGISIGNQIQWTNLKNGRTVYGRFDGTTIKAVSESGYQEFSLVGSQDQVEEQPPDDASKPQPSPYEVLTSSDYQWAEPVFIGHFETAKNLDEALPDDFVACFEVTRNMPTLMRNDDVTNDVWILRREPGASSWNTPIRHGVNVNTQYKDGWPAMTSDQLTLVLSSDRPRGFGMGDLWFYRRDKVEDPWSGGVNMGPEFNTYGPEWACHCFGSTELYFTRAPKRGLADIWCARRGSSTESWSMPVKLRRVCGDDPDSEPVLSSDGLVMLFASRRPSDFEEANIWMTTREQVGGEWSTPVCLPAPINSDGDESPWMILDDGDETLLVFRRPELGYWSIRRERKSPESQ